MEHVSQLAQVIQSVDVITSDDPNKYKQLLELEEFAQFAEKLLQLIQEMIASEVLKYSLQVENLSCFFWCDVKSCVFYLFSRMCC